jgi:hypothetical protein
MDISSVIGGIIGGVISASGVAAFVANAAKERWMARVKAAYAVELESIKAELERTKLEFQAKLDQGTYVTKAQYDLELGAYKDLWIALADLRTVARSVYGIDYFYSKVANPAGRALAKERAMQALKDAHNKAVQIVDHMAPFYAKEVQNKARGIASKSSATVQHAREWAEDESVERWKIVESEINDLSDLVEQLDGMIRERLTSLRVIH